MTDKDFKALMDRLGRIERMIVMSTKEVLTVDECAAYTGLSKTHLYRLTSTKAIRFYKPGGRNVYFRKSDIDDFLLRGGTESSAGVSVNAATFINGERKRISGL